MAGFWTKIFCCFLLLTNIYIRHVCKFAMLDQNLDGWHFMAQTALYFELKSLTYFAAQILLLHHQKFYFVPYIQKDFVELE